MSKLLSLLKKIESKIVFRETSNLMVSKADVAWHLDHSLKVINSVISGLKKSNPEEYKWKLHFKRSFFLTIGSIPRGKARAPKSVQSFENSTLEDIQKQLETARFLVNELQGLPKNSNINHPYIGILNLKQATRFLEIHTHHHIKIMNDIITN
jgi:hypothetical protein